MSDAPTYMQKVLAGEAFLEQIDEYVELWHDSDVDLPLSAYLGMTSEEYGLWVEKPQALRFIVFSRKNSVPLPEAVAIAEGDALAARSSEKNDAKAVMDWLRATNRL